MQKTLIPCLILSFIFELAFASNNNSISNQNVAVNPYSAEVSSLNQNAQARAHDYNTLATFLGQNATPKTTNPHAATGVIVFVSLGMPVVSLRQIITSATELHIPVVVRGLLNNNFKDSAKVLYSVLHPPGEAVINGGLEIDPVWFEGFGITEVPAVVAVPPGVSCTDKTPCTSNQFDVVYGNIPVPEALAIIAKQGSVGRNIAAQVLSSLGSGANAYED